MKEVTGLVEGEERIRFFASQGSVMASKLKTLTEIKGSTKRKSDDVLSQIAKRRLLDADTKKKIDLVRKTQMQKLSQN